MDRAHRRRFLIAYGIWLFGAFAYFVPSATWSPVSRFNLTRAVVELGTLSVDAYAESTGDRAQRDGHWYCDKAPFPSLAAVPVYAAFYAYNAIRGAKLEVVAFATPDTPAQRVEVNHTYQQGLYVCSLSTSAAAGTALGLLLFLILGPSLGTRNALWASASIVLATPLFAYSTSFYGHVPAAALFFGAVAAITVDWRTAVLDGEPSVATKPSRLRIAGACLVSAVGCEYLTAVPALFLLAFILWCGRARIVQTVWQLSLGGVLPLAILIGYQWRCFGLPWKTAYSFIVRPEFARGHAHGFLGVTVPSVEALFGLTFGGSRGLFLIAPVTLIGFALALRGRSGSNQAANPPGNPPAAFALDVRHALAAGAFALLLVNASYYMWWGGASFGPRHLLTVVPLAAYGIARACLHRWGRVVVALLALVSFAKVLMVTMVGLEAPEQVPVFTQYAWPHLLEGKVAALSGASNIGLLLGLPSIATFGPIVVWLLIGGRVVTRTLPKEDPLPSLPKKEPFPSLPEEEPLPKKG